MLQINFKHMIFLEHVHFERFVLGVTENYPCKILVSEKINTGQNKKKHVLYRYVLEMRLSQKMLEISFLSFQAKPDVHGSRNHHQKHTTHNKS